MLKNVLTIAGSDPSGGAGIQADLKTMCALGVYGMSAITAVTVQNTRKVFDVQEIDPEIVRGQIDAVYGDIPAHAVKIGMVSNARSMRAIRERLLHHRAPNIVLDPVMMSKSGCRLLKQEVERELATLFPIAMVATPNLMEAGALAEMDIRSHDGMLAAARKIRELGVDNVLVKGGGPMTDQDDLLLLAGEPVWLPGPRLATRNTHGTGCTLSSAIACNLAKGMALREAATEAKAYVTRAIENGLDIGHGVGPLGHLVELYREANIIP